MLKTLLGLLAVLAFAASPALAANVTIVGNDNQTPIGGALTALGCSQISSLSSSTGLSAPTGSQVAVITVETQAVRYRDDGTAPTASVGFPLAVGQAMTAYGSAELKAIKFIQQTASATLDVCFYA